MTSLKPRTSSRGVLGRVSQLALLRLLAVVGNLAVVAMIVRLYEPEQAGLYFVFLAVAQFAGNALLAPLNQIALRFGAVHQDSQDSSGTVALLAFGGAVIALACALLAAAFGLAAAFTGTLKPFGISSLAVAATVLVGTIGFLTGLTRVRGRIMSSQIPESILRPYGMVALVALSAGGLAFFPSVSLEFLFLTVLCTCVAFLAWRSGLVAQVEPLHSGWRDHVRQYAGAYPNLMIYATAGALLSSVDVVLVSGLVGVEDVPTYKVAAQFAMLMGSGIIFANILYGPTMAIAHSKGDHTGLQRAVRQSSRLSLAIALAGLLGALTLPGVFGLAFGDAGRDAYPLILILALGRIVDSWFGSSTNLATMTGHTAPLVIAQLAGGAVLIICAVLFAPVAGTVGVAAAAVASMVLWNSALAVQLSRRLRLKLGPI